MKQRRKRQEGAVLVEAVIALSMLVLMFALLTLVHRLSLSSLDATQEARSKAWQKALTGCKENDFSLTDLIRSVKSGELPAPSSFTGGGVATASVSRTVQGPDGKSHALTRRVEAPCNTRAIAAPSGGAGDWLFDLFDH
jgi:hypothetical protein